MSSPFGFLVPPLPPLVPPELVPETVSANQLAYAFPASSIGSHISVFLLPGQTLPAGSAAALYIRFPNQNDFSFLGALGEGKASAVFRVAGLKGDGGATAAPAGGEVDMDADGADPLAQGSVTVGVSLEPADEVAAKVAQARGGSGASATVMTTTNGTADSLALVRRGAGAATGSGGNQPSTKVLAQRIIKNAFNFLASFEGETGMVPIKAFEGWWQKFERRVQNDPGFLEREQD